MGAPAPYLSICIVNWNVRDLLRRSLTSIYASPIASVPNTVEVIVVDNASSDGSAEMVRSEFPLVKLVENARNEGFTRGNNQALALAHGRYVLFLNPDTEVADDALRVMARYLDSHPEVGAVGPQLRYPNRLIQPSRRRFPTAATLFLESTLLQQWFPRHAILSRFYMADTPDDVEQEVDWLVGAALMVRREAIEKVGGFDERFFMYSEELDWCRRAKSAGWKIVYLPQAMIIHHEGRSSGQVVAARHIHFYTSKVLYARKYHGKVMAEALRLFLLATFGWQVAEEGAKWLLGHKRPLRSARIKEYLEVLKSGLRPGGQRA